MISYQNNMHLSKSSLEKIRLKLLQAQIKYCYKNIPFYKKTLRKLKLKPEDFKTLDDLKKLPIITRDDIIKSPNEFLNPRFKKNKLCKSHTSGSCGKPLLSYFDRKTWVKKKFISKIRARKACGYKIFNKIAVFEADSKKDTEKHNLKFANIVFQKKKFSVFKQPSTVLKRLIKFNPDTLYGFPSYIFEICQELEKTNKRLNDVKRVFTSSEYLEKNVKEHIEKVLDVKVYDIYGNTEIKEIAWQCKEQKGYHINEDEVIVEIIENNKPQKPGKEGDIVVTDLINKAMPLLRYNTEDRGKINKEPCTCNINFSTMQITGGRKSEFVLLPNGQKIIRYSLTSPVSHVKGVLEYRIIQKTKNLLETQVILDKNTDKKRP